MDDPAAMSRPFGEVAVVPDIVETLETGGAVFGAVIVVPKANGQGGKSARADQPPFSPRTGPPSSSHTSTARARPGP